MPGSGFGRTGARRRRCQPGRDVPRRLGYQQTSSELPLTVIRHPENLGYGGNQKAGYQWAIEHGLDIVVLLHGDGQYAPESCPRWSRRSSATRPTRCSARA